jgi:hypothetical protein
LSEIKAHRLWLIGDSLPPIGAALLAVNRMISYSG